MVFQPIWWLTYGNQGNTISNSPGNGVVSPSNPDPGQPVTGGGYTVYVADQANNEVVLISTGSNSIIDKIPISSPKDIAVDSTKTYIYVANGSHTSKIRLSDGSIVSQLATNNNTDGITYLGTIDRVYACEYNSGTTVSIGLSTFTINASIKIGGSFGSAPQRLAASPNNDYVFVADWNNGGSLSGAVEIIDTSTNTHIKTINTAPGYGGVVDVVVTPDGKYCYGADYSDGTVVVIDIATQTLTKTIGLGTYPSSITVSPDGNHIWVGYAGNQKVAVIDTATNTVSARIDGMTEGIEGIAVTPDGNYVYAAGYGGNVYVIDTKTLAVVDTITVGSGSGQVLNALRIA